MAFLAPLAIAAGASAGTAGTLATIGSIASVVGGGISALGAIQQGKAQAASAKYNAQVAANNATIQTQNAERAAQAGTAAVEQASLKNRAEAGAIKANQGASGVALDSGSSFDVRSSASQLGELNALTVRSNALQQAYGYQVEASNATAQSQLDRAQAKNDLTSSYISAGSTLLGTAGNASTNYASYLQNGGL